MNRSSRLLPPTLPIPAAPGDIQVPASSRAARNATTRDRQAAVELQRSSPQVREPNRPSPPTGWIRQRIESIVNTLKDQLLLERHGARTPAGLLARITARVLALCACVNLNQQLGLSSRSLTPYTD
jgi:hypothetical protein